MTAKRLPNGLIVLVAFAIALVAFGLAQLASGLGMPFVMAAATIWTAFAAYHARGTGGR